MRNLIRRFLAFNPPITDTDRRRVAGALVLAALCVGGYEIHRSSDPAWTTFEMLLLVALVAAAAFCIWTDR